MLYKELEFYVLKSKFDFMNFTIEQNIYFNETYPQYKLNSIGVYESDYDIDTFKILVRFEYEE